MANLTATPPETDQRIEAPGHALARFSDGKMPNLGGEDVFKQEGIFASIWHSIEDAFFPKKLPPLVLQSRPVAVVDRMAVKRDPLSTAIAVGLHVAVIGLVIWLLAKGVKVMTGPKAATIVSLDAPPPPLPPKLKMAGGGGGQKGPAPVSKGSPPKFSPNQIVPPKLAVDKPKLAVLPTIDVDPNLHMTTNMPNIGMANAPNVGVSMGNGNGSGLGSGNGNGLGPGSGGNTGGGVRQVGGGVSAPVAIYKPEPEFSEEARKAKLSGPVTVDIVVDAKGNVRSAHVIHGLGMGLDEKALEAVKLYRFKPGLENGKPVPVEVYVEIDFQIF